MTARTAYDQAFYDSHAEGVLASARVVVPLVQELVAPFSVVDVGCGEGAWLSVFVERGVADVAGFDGAHVDRARLRIPSERFTAHDLATPLPAGRTFDLAISLEVAEHLPALRADAFVETLAALAPAVLFSAAIPGQGGREHVNEQWPDYWVGRFEARGYVAFDCLREKLWNDRAVSWWYAQNVLLLARRDALARWPKLAALTPSRPLPLVHPELLRRKAAELEAASDPRRLPVSFLLEGLARKVLRR